MFRALSLFALLAALWACPCTSYADALPSPNRPEWEHTPLPMPEDPEDVGLTLLVVAVALAFAGSTAVRRRARS